MSIKKAVITAAGRGTRFLPAVKAYPKEMIPILNKPQIQYIVEEAIGAGVTEICIVHLEGNLNIPQYFTPDHDIEDYLKSVNKEDLLDSLRNIWNKANLHFIPQPKSLPYGNSSPMIAALNFIGQDPFFYLFGDDLTLEKTPGGLLTQMANQFESASLDAIFAVQPVPHEDIHRYGCIEYQAVPLVPNQIVRVIEKPDTDVAPSDMANGGRALVRNEITSLFKAHHLGKNNELWFVDGLNQLASKGLVVTQNYLEADSRWYTTGDPKNWLKANMAMAEASGIDLL